MSWQGCLRVLCTARFVASLAHMNMQTYPRTCGPHADEHGPCMPAKSTFLQCRLICVAVCVRYEWIDENADEVKALRESRQPPHAHPQVRHGLFQPYRMQHFQPDVNFAAQSLAGLHNLLHAGTAGKRAAGCPTAGRRRSSARCARGCASAGSGARGRDRGGS